MDDTPRLTWKRNPGALALRYSFLAVAGFAALLPLVWMVSTALKPAGEALTRVSANPFDPMFWPTVPRWLNFTEVWVSDDFGAYLVHSLILSLATVTGVLVTSVPAAFALARLRFPGKKVLFSLLLATLMVPEIVAMVPNFLVISALGWVDTWQGLTVPFMAGAFYIIFLHQFIRQVPEPLFDSARIDGAGPFRTLVQLVVPLTGGPLLTVVFLDILATWNSLAWPLLVSQTPRWRPVSVGLARFVSEAGAQTELQMAAALVVLAPVVVVFLVAQKHITATLVSSGIKG